MFMNKINMPQTCPYNFSYKQVIKLRTSKTGHSRRHSGIDVRHTNIAVVDGGTKTTFYVSLLQR